MRSFTRSILLMMAMFFSVAIVVGQSGMTAEEAADYQALNYKDPGTIVTVTPDNDGSRATGDDCTDPIIVSVPGDLTYTDMGQTNCGRGNDYSSTCLGSYDGGEDVVYRLDVSSNVMITITMDPLGTTWSGLALFEGCPDVGTCISYSTGSSGTTPKVLASQELTGRFTYYIMVDTWPSPSCIPSFNLEIVDATPVYVPVTAFPYMTGYEGGVIPDEFTPLIQTYSGVDVSTDAAYNGSYGLRLKGGSSSSGYSTYSNGADAFANNTSHIAKTLTQVEPSGQPGLLRMRFDHKMVCTYNQPNYSWFRVTIDGVPVADENGDTYFQPSAGGNGDPFEERLFDLSAYQGGNFTIGLESCCKYQPGYTSTYIWGDCAYIDEFEIYYEQEPGDVEGYVFNYYGLAVSGATVTHESGIWTNSGANGYYFLETVPYGMQELFCGKAGYNTTSAMIDVPTGGLAQLDFTLTQPSMVINPLFIEETLNPGEYYTTSVGVLNNGTGELDWSAVIVYPPVAADYPKYPAGGGIEINYGQESDPLSFNRADAGDQVLGGGNRDVGDIIDQFGAPSPISLVWGAGNDFNNLWFTDPNLSATTIYEVDYDGATTGNTITLSLGQSWIGDMASDGTYLYCCLVGGSNNIAVIDLSDGSLVEEISGAYNITSQRGLGYDQNNEEFYIGGWNSDQIWRVDATGATISQTPFLSVSGLEWHPNGGPDAEGALWVVENSPADNVTEVDPNDGWVTLQSFVQPGSSGYCGAGLALDGTGALWVPNQCVNTVYLVDTEEPLSGGGPGSWLTMDYYEGTVQPFGGVDNVPTHMNAANTSPGDVYTADIVFTSEPFVGEITVPVTMIILGDSLVGPDELEVTLANDVTGEALLTWEFNQAGGNFNFFIIKRDGVIVGTTANMSYIDMLPDYGTYCYTVQAVYDEGQSAPVGPECVEWPNPDLFVDPDDLHGWVWVGFTVDVYTTIYNNGEGTLQYTFPEFVALDLVNDPNIEQNQTGYPSSIRSFDTEKGDEATAGMGYPVVLGAGGPDDFGYTWIDSDETGGPNFEWVDILATGTTITGLSDDNNVGPFPIGFDFNFYGEDKTEFWVNSNGTICFKSTYITLSNYSIPTNNTTYNDLIAWFWDDCHPASSTVKYETFNDKLVILFDNYSRFGQTSYTFDCEVILYKNGRIMIMYDNISPNLTITSATVGIQSSDPSLGLQVAYNTGYIHDELAVRLSALADFIVDVEPAMGLVGENSSADITITYDSDGYEPGDYTQELLLESNDPDQPEYIIDNTMHVYTPAQFAGTVVDNDDNSPLPGVMVTAGAFQTATQEDGTYSLYVDEGTYDVFFEKVGYQTVVVADTFAMEGVVTPIDIGMWDLCNPPAFVNAEVMDDDTWVEVTWALPAGPYEIIMDDGEADDFALWQGPGSMNAVKFTPSAYPATAVGGAIYVGDGTFPGPFLGSDFGVAIFDDDGTNGMPGTMLDSAGVTVNNYGWVTFDWLNAEITDGDYFLAMIQTNPAPFAAPIGIDTDNPTYFKSYSKFMDQDWMLSAYQDFMMRAYLYGPEGAAAADNAGNKMMYPSRVPQNWQEYFMTASGTVPSILPGVERDDVNYRGVDLEDGRDIEDYTVSRFSNFDPNGSPEVGDETQLATTSELFYNDYAWAGLPQGWYAYGVRTNCTSEDQSDFAISNIVGHLMDFEVTVNVTLSTGEEPINVDIVMQGLDWPYETFMATTPASGTVVFDMVWLGNYDLVASKIGFDDYVVEGIFVNQDMEINIVLAEKKYMPTNLYVDPLTLEATWSEPLITAVNEDFEAPAFPPPGWQSLTEGDGWFRTNNGSSGSFPIPTWDSYYACANDDAVSDNVGCCDYLITPALDLRDGEGYMMSFDSYYDGAFGQLAFVEYSLDAGATWEVLYQVSPAAAWTLIEQDLSGFSGASGPDQIWFAFHSDDAGAWASGWAVDNPLIQIPSPAANYIDFYVFLDDAFVGSTTETNWNYAPLTYGVEYTASVAARYTSGLSAKDYYTFLCVYLFPPRDLQGYAPDDAAHLTWLPPSLGETAMQADGEYPKYSLNTSEVVYGSVVDPLAINRSSANDQVINNGSRDVGDVLLSWPAPSPIALAWGAGFDGENLWLTDPNLSATTIYEVDTDGMMTGNTITISLGQSWIGDMASDGTYLYCCLVGGSNNIAVIDLSDYSLVGEISGAYNITSQRGLAYDDVNDEYYIGGWNSDMIWRCDATGATISTTSFLSVSGLEWHPGGGPNAEGSLWVVENSPADNVSEIDPNDNWAPLQSFVQPGSVGYCGAGLALDVTGALWVPNQCNNTVYLVDTEEPLTPPVGGLPDGLLGYNIYRDGDFVNYVAHVGDDPEQVQAYVDEGLQPGIYAYTATAIYDLEQFGFPGEEGESMEEGPFMVVVDYCYDLEFMETWTLGNFDANNWGTDGANWSINGQEGMPAPAAEFTWDPIVNDYAIGMESFPLCAVGMTEGTIMVDFDLMLDDVNPTGEEFLHVQVWNWDNQDWQTVKSYSNVDGSIPWTSESVDIKNYAMDRVFKIRFLAQGVNSLNILSWFVDNIHVYRTCAPATNLVAMEDFDQPGIVLTWENPSGGQIAEWIHYDDGVNFDAIGTDGPVEFDVAARWEPDQLVNYAGASVTQVAFFPNEAAATYSVRIWTGAGPANLVVDQPVASPVIGSWNYVTLDSPFPIDVTQELWIGYYVNTTIGYPAGCDQGPAIDGYGNMMNFGGWQTLLQINPDLNYNWNIQAYVETVASATVPLSIETESYSVPSDVTLDISGDPNTVSPYFNGENASRILTGVNIWRSVDGADYEIVDFVADPEQTYLDPGDDLMVGSVYCYMVQAVYEGEEGDVCEAAPTAEVCLPWTIGINDPTASAEFNMYPNPATNHVFINSSSELKRVTVYSTLGQLVADEIVSGNEYELKTSTFVNGVYMVRVESEAGVTTRALNVRK